MDSRALASTWPDSMTSAGSRHVGACGAAGPGKGEPPGRGRCRRARKFDVSPPLHSQAPPDKAPETQPAPPVASGDEGDEATRTWAVQGGGTERGGRCCGPFRGPGTCPMQPEHSRDSGKNRRAPQGPRRWFGPRARPALSRSGPRQTPGRCVRKAQRRGHTARHTGCSAFTRRTTQRAADPQHRRRSAARQGDAHAPARCSCPPPTRDTGRRAAAPSPGSVTQQLAQGRAAAPPSGVAEPRAGWRPSARGS